MVGKNEEKSGAVIEMENVEQDDYGDDDEEPLLVRDCEWRRAILYYSRAHWAVLIFNNLNVSSHCMAARRGKSRQACLKRDDNHSIPIMHA